MPPRKSPKSGSPGPGPRRDPLKIPVIDEGETSQENAARIQPYVEVKFVRLPGPKPEAKHGGNKNGKKEGISGSSFFTWFMVIALLGVWTSVAVVWFELVDYEEVLGKLGIYDADGDGDFDVEDAKILLGLTKDGNNENIDSLEEVLNILAEESSDWFYGFLSFLYDVMTPFEIIEEEESDAADDVDGLKERSVQGQPSLKDADEVIEPAKERYTRAEHASADEAEPEDEIQSLLREVLESQLVKEQAGDADEEDIPEETNLEEDVESNEIPEAPTLEEDYDGEVQETHESIRKDPASDYQPEEPETDDTHVTYEYHTHVEEDTFQPESPDDTELNLEDALEHNTDERELNLEDTLEHNTDDTELNLEDALDHDTEDTEQQDYVDEHDLENEDFIEVHDSDEEPLTEYHHEDIKGEPIDTTEHTHEHETEDSDYFTEHIESEDEREHMEDHGGARPHETEVPIQEEDYSNDDLVGQEKETQQKEKAKKKKPKLFNKFDKGIKTELDGAEKLRKKGKVEEALKVFETLVNKYPQSPRARYGKAQSEDDLAEKMRSNEILQRSINTYGEVASLSNVPDDLVKLALKRRADRQQFLGRMRGSLVTLQKLVNLFPNDTSFKNNLGVGYLLIGDNNNAKRVYEEVLDLAPNDGFAKVHYGFILKAENKIEESIPYLKEGLETGDPGTDDGRFYFHLGDAMQRVGNSEAYKWYERGHQRGHFASVWQRSLYNVKGLKAQPWWTAKETGYTELVKSLERNWKMIRDEGLAVMDRGKGLFLPEDENLREKGDWSQFTLWQQGRKNEKACNSVSKTCALLERFPETTGCRRGQIKYSVMHPGTHVWPHTGPTNCRLRMHLGLVIPKEGCRIRCAQETRFWEEGKVVIFDDSFEHEVWQDAQTYRLIFIVDVWHPELTPQQRLTLPAI